MKQKLVPISIITTILSVTAGVFFWYISSNHNDNPLTTINYDPPTQEEINIGTQIKKESVESDQTSKNSQVQTNVSMSLAPVSVSGTVVKIRVTIAGSQTGYCLLTLSGPQGQVVTKSANLQAMASYSTCQGFDVPKTELSSGTWTFVIDGSFSSDRTGQTNGEFVI